MHSASHSDILLVSATLVLIAVVAGFVGFRKSPDLQYRYDTVFDSRVQADDSVIEKSEQPVTNTTLPQESQSVNDYQNNIKDLLKSYNSETLNYFAAETVYKQNLDKLLNMSVPSGYQQFHLDLVIAFEDLQKAVSSVINDEAAAKSDLEAAREQMDLLLQQHSWIQR